MTKPNAVELLIKDVAFFGIGASLGSIVSLYGSLIWETFFGETGRRDLSWAEKCQEEAERNECDCEIED